MLIGYPANVVLCILNFRLVQLMLVFNIQFAIESLLNSLNIKYNRKQNAQNN